MSEPVWVKSKTNTSLWHMYKDTQSDKNWRGVQTTWTECLTQLWKETITSPVPPMFERGGKKYWMKRVCRSCEAYYREVVSRERS
jgi:hypothetical protein